MATKAAELAIGVTTDAADAVAGFADVDRAADKMSRSVADAGDTAADTSRRLGLSADAADDMAGKTGKATGALGALAGGLEAVGLEKYAGALQGASIATDFASGAGDALNLVMESTILQNARARVATIGRTIAEKAAAAGTAVMTAGQWALNAAMSANPVGLIVVALVALVAGLVLAYKKSETVRTIIQAVGKVGRQAIGSVVSAVSDLVGWVKDRLPGAFSTAKRLVVGYLTLITLPLRTVVTVASNIVTWVSEKIPAAFETAKNKAAEIKEAIIAPFRSVANFVQSILDKISKIKVPDLNPFRTIGGSAGSAGAITGTATSTGGTSVLRLLTPVTQNSYTFNISGALDSDATARQIRDLLYRYDRTFGTTS